MFLPRTPFAALLVLLSAPSAPAAALQIFPHLSPVDAAFSPTETLLSPSYGTYLSNLFAALGSGVPNAGGSQSVTPSAFNTLGAPVTNGSIAVSVGAFDVAATSFNSWRGQLNPPGAFSAELGTHYRTAVRVTDASPFTLADVFFLGSYPASFGPPQPPVALADIFAGGQAARFLGRSWGTNGIAGDGDDVIYDASNPMDASTPLNELIFAGLGDLVALFTAPGELPEDAMAGWLAFVASEPFEFSHSYSLRDATATVNVSVVAEPEPATMLISATVLIGLAARRSLAHNGRHSRNQPRHRAAIAGRLSLRQRFLKGF